MRLLRFVLAAVLQAGLRHVGQVVTALLAGA